MKNTLRLFREWRGMGPDNPRDVMPDPLVWRMEDYVPKKLGSSLESRQGWTYHVATPLDNFVTAQIWVNTLGGSHHLAATPTTLYNLDVPTAARTVTTVGADAAHGALWPMATLYEYVMVPRIGDTQPVFLRYAAGVEVLVATHASIPKGKVGVTWQNRFVLANALAQPNRLYFLSQEWGAGLTTTPAWDPKAYWDTVADVTALAATRNSLLIFHEGSVERLRGTKAPGEGVDDDVWMEPLIGLGGCNEPHSICQWNDNIAFADARGVYLTDGTQIKDITKQGGIAEEWRKAYDPNWRVAAGVVKDQYVVTMTDTTNKVFKKCFVCDLESRSWSVFNNMPFPSFVESLGEVEAMYGGGLDGRVGNVTKIWTVADPTTDTKDANGVSVLPQLETAWYRMSENMQMKRIKNLYFAFDLDESTGSVRVYGTKQPQPLSTDWVLLKTIQEGDLLDNRGVSTELAGINRRRIPVGVQAYGMAVKIETAGTLKNLKVFDLAAELVPDREQTYV